MNKELIKKYKTEFDHWLNGGSVVYLIDEWKPITDSFNWNRPGYIKQMVIDDDYVELRKSAAEGKQMQVSYDDGIHWYDKSTNKLLWSKHQWVRVKPEHEFEVGDWVRIEYGDNQTQPTKPFRFECMEKSERGLSANNGSYWSGSRFKAKVVIWTPIEGDWCVFYKSHYKHTFKVAKYTDRIRKKYKFCEPFTGTIPDNFKDN